MFYMFITIAVGGIIGYILNKLKIPGGLLIGSMVGVAILNIAVGMAYIPDDTKVFVQIVAGALIGCSMEKSDFVRLPQIIKPAIIMLTAFLILNISIGFLIYFISPLDLATSLMSVVPGGISDTPVLAANMGADGPKVAMMQLVRQILGIGVFPTMIYEWNKKREARIFAEINGNLVSREIYKEKRKKTTIKSWQAFVTTVIIATIFGILGRISGLISATFIFPIISILVLKLKFNFAYIPRWAKRVAQIFSGCYLGSTVEMLDVLELRYLVFPMIIIILGYMINCFVTGKIISSLCGFTHKEGMLITTPAGASDMALISSELGVENTDIIILQIIRAVVVMSVFPQIVYIITSIADNF